jgi:hypothetical protein
MIIIIFTYKNGNWHYLIKGVGCNSFLLYASIAKLPRCSVLNKLIESVY